MSSGPNLAAVHLARKKGRSCAKKKGRCASQFKKGGGGDRFLPRSFAKSAPGGASVRCEKKGEHFAAPLKSKTSTDAQKGSALFRGPPVRGYQPLTDQGKRKGTPFPGQEKKREKKKDSWLRGEKGTSRSGLGAGKRENPAGSLAVRQKRRKTRPRPSKRNEKIATRGEVTAPRGRTRR